MNLQILPIGIQTFSEIIERDYLYVDKTQHIHRLITAGKYFFLSRPRRFGKSLLLSTIKSIYQGRKELFKGLWIEDQWNWEKAHPVVHIGFSSLGYSEIGLETAISRGLLEQAKHLGLSLESKTPSTLFYELIRKAVEKYGNRVVLLIDEYDKPLIDYLAPEEIPQAKEHQKILKTFYSVIKDSDAYLEFLLITGVSKFSKISIFSELNNLRDISLDRKFVDMLGITEGEMKHFFAPHLTHSTQVFQLDYEALLLKIKEWYNGYSWDGRTRVYNPWSLMSFFTAESFENFWFATGTPTFLIKQIRKNRIIDFENQTVDSSTFLTYDIERLELLPLMFQTGYLTVLRVDEFGLFEIGYPNKEVKESLLRFLIGSFREDETPLSTPLAINLYKAFAANDLEQVMRIVKSIFKNIPSHIFIADKEYYYHSILYLIFLLLGHYIECEINTNNGRLDAVLKTKERIYVIEFKLDKSAEAALAQIKERKYDEKYHTDGREVVLLGINFSSEEKSVEGWKMEIFPN
ncbi:MAG: ATP-binding protein [Bacteroidota bacterium]